jgi:endogenous inhibitor of DNA gyrase (YacG/DUF329 family)
MTTRICQNCGTPLTGTKRRFCSDRCLHQDWARRHSAEHTVYMRGWRERNRARDEEPPERRAARERLTNLTDQARRAARRAITLTQR